MDFLKLDQFQDMSLQERIASDLIAAQKSGASARVNVARLMLSEIKNKEIEKRGAGPSGGAGARNDAILDDAAVIEVLRREVKKRKEAIELFKKGNRPDLAESDEADIAIINEYLPAFMSREEIIKVVDEVRASGASDFPSIMRAVMKQLKGKADGAGVAEIIKSRLSS